MINIKKLTKLFVTTGFILAFTNTSITFAQSNESASAIGPVNLWGVEFITPENNISSEINKIAASLKVKNIRWSDINHDDLQMRMSLNVSRASYYDYHSNVYIVANSEWQDINPSVANEFQFYDVPLLFSNENYITCEIEFRSLKNPKYYSSESCVGMTDHKVIEREVIYIGNTNLVPVFRYWNNTTKSHVFTSNIYEKTSIDLNREWEFDGVAYYAGAYHHSTQECKIEGQEMVYRFWSDKYDAHFYSINKAEIEHIKANYPVPTWQYEGPAYCAYPTEAENSSPVYRFWSDTYENHFFTNNEEEKDIVINNYSDDIWKYENINFYVAK